MASKLEKRTRELDDLSMSVAENARRLTQQIGLRAGTITNYIHAKRHGYSSYAEYHLDKSKKKHTPRKIREQRRKRDDRHAQSRGFKDRNEYSSWLYWCKRMEKRMDLDEFRNLKKNPPARNYDSKIIDEMMKRPPTPDSFSETEQQIIELDSPRTRPYRVVAKIAKRLELKEVTVRQYLRHLRLGHSAKDYSDADARLRGFTDSSERVRFNYYKMRNSGLSLEQFRKDQLERGGFESQEQREIFEREMAEFFPGIEKNSNYYRQKLFEYTHTNINRRVRKMRASEIDPITDDEKTIIAKILSTLSPREQEVIYYRFYHRPHKEMTLKETGQKMRGISREGARQAQARALRKLRHPTRLKKLEEVWLNLKS